MSTVFLSFVVSCITQSITIRKIIGKIKQPCLTPVFTSKSSVSFPLWIIWHVALSYSCWMRFTNTDRIPLWCNSFHMTSRSTLSKAFLKSMKFRYKVDCQSKLCSMIMRSVAIWSMQDLSFLNPACSGRSRSSTASFSRSRIMRVSILLGTDRSMMPCQFLQSPRSPFLGSFTR